jgi:TP901 family phage tail tape measure protein
MWELLPFWHTFFTKLGFAVYHSPLSSRDLYLKGQATIPSDTACFPAKLAHGHIQFLSKLGLDAIFYPCMTYNIDEGLGDNHYNCPVVAYYPEVIAGNCPEIKGTKFIYDYVGLHRPKDFSRKIWDILRRYFPDVTRDEVREAGDASQEFGDKSKSAVDQLAQAIVAAGLAEKVKDVAKALYDCVDTFAAFESQMSTVQAISGATAEEMARLTEKAQYMGSTTSFTATEAGKALEYMAMAGWKTGDMLDGLEGILYLAAASGEDLAATSDIVTDALTAFGLAASDSAHFADVLAKASSNSNTNVRMMGETFKYAAPVAGTLGYSIEDTALAVGLMANASIKASQAGTTLRSIFTRLATDAGASSTKLGALGVLTKQVGVEFYDMATQKARPLADVLMDCREAWKGYSDEQQTAWAKTIAGQEAMSGWLAIMNAADSDVEKLTAALQECSGAAYEMSQIQLDNYAGQLTLLDSAVDGLKLTIGSQLAPVLEELASGATTAVGGAGGTDHGSRGTDDGFCGISDSEDHQAPFD